MWQGLIFKSNRIRRQILLEPVVKGRDDRLANIDAHAGPLTKGGDYLQKHIHAPG